MPHLAVHSTVRIIRCPAAQSQQHEQAANTYTMWLAYWAIFILKLSSWLSPRRTQHACTFACLQTPAWPTLPVPQTLLPCQFPADQLVEQELWADFGGSARTAWQAWLDRQASGCMQSWSAQPRCSPPLLHLTPRVLRTQGTCHQDQRHTKLSSLPGVAVLGLHDERGAQDGRPTVALPACTPRPKSAVCAVLGLRGERGTQDGHLSGPPPCLHCHPQA